MLPSNTEAVIHSLSEELERRLSLKLRFNRRWMSLPESIRDRYFLSTYKDLTESMNAGQILAHARNLGMNPSIDRSVKIKPRNEVRNLEKQARDFIRFMLDFDEQFNRLIDYCIQQNLSRTLEYNYLEHLTK